MKIKIAPSDARGFAMGKFKDRYGAECSIQKSSLATEDCIWLGIREVQHKKFPGDNTGWHDCELPTDVHCFARMHLSQQQVKDLLPLLHRFVKTGDLYPPRKRKKKTVAN